MKGFRRVAAALTALTLLVTPATVSAAVPTQPVQGATIVFEDNTRCTIGYNDHGNGVSYTAAHCAQKGARVALVDTKSGIRSKMLGTFEPSENFQFPLGNDWGRIKWDEGVTLGGNVYSGDTIVSLDDVRAGEQVCFHGEVTHENSNDVECGEYSDRGGQSFVTNIKSAAHGDSGGPMWIPGRGFIGVVSGGSTVGGTGFTLTIGDEKKVAKPVLWGAAPFDGERMGEQEYVKKSLKAGGVELPDNLNIRIDLPDYPPMVPAPVAPTTKPAATSENNETRNPVAPTPTSTSRVAPTPTPQQSTSPTVVASTSTSAVAPATTTTSTTPNTAATTGNASAGGSSLSTGAIIGIVVAIIAAVGLAGAAFMQMR
ncbi:trypsin-like serine protease [Corynebacterium sp. Marseille-P4321]|uniref:trypsin-like serine protease n=1 Tax=Corynebacterium sp. Marseille-P4321 TaxID=2736603 RepID=UPI00158B4253|nr:trypsin-like serine protease [Corynebacterium sp. Marseille-P4321]